MNRIKINNEQFFPGTHSNNILKTIGAEFKIFILIAFYILTSSGIDLKAEVNLLAHWSMDEIASGHKIADKSGHGNDAQIKGILGALTFTQGVSGKAALFDGTGNGYLMVQAGNSLKDLREFTIMGFVKYPELFDLEEKTGNYPTFFYSQGPKNKYISLWFFTGFRTNKWSRRRMVVQILPINEKKMKTSKSNVLKWEKDRWYNLAVSVNTKNKEIKFFRDGILINKRNIPDNYLWGADKIFIGSFGGRKGYAGYAMKGFIDEVKIFDKALSAAEINSRISLDKTIVKLEKIDMPLKIDGNLNDPAWQKAVKLQNFKRYTGGPPHKKTEVLVCYDSTNIYFGFKNFDDNAKNLKANVNENEHDGKIWFDDCVEVFIGSNQIADKDGKGYFQFLVNSRGAKTECKIRYGLSNMQWNGKWTAKTQKTDKWWTAEISVPFRTLGISQFQPGTILNVSLNREEQKTRELSGWPDGSFHQPDNFGKLLLGKYKENLLLGIRGQLDKLAELGRRIAGLKANEALKTGFESLRKEVENEQENISSAKITDPTVWKNCKERIFSLKKRTAQIETETERAGLLASGQTFLVLQKNPWKNLRKNKIFTVGKPCSQIKLTIGSGEFESTAFVITNLIDDGSNKFKIIIGKNPFSIKLRQGYHVPTPVGIAVNDALPLIENSETTIKYSKEIWLDLDSTGVKPGNYKIPVTIASRSNTFITELNIDVVPIRFSQNCQAVPIYNTIWDYVARMPKDLRKEARKDLENHYITVPFLSPSAVPWPSNGNINYGRCDEQLDVFLPKRNFKMLGFYLLMNKKYRIFGNKFMSPEWKKNFSAWFSNFTGHLKSKGLECDDFFLSLIDEDVSKRHLELAKLIKEINPDIKIFVNPGVNYQIKGIENIAPYCDIWMPYIYSLIKDERCKMLIKIMQAKGKFFWSYANPPGGNAQNQCPYAIYRLVPWRAWKYGMHGSGFWCYSYSPRSTWTLPEKGKAYSYDVVYLSKYAPEDVCRKERIIPSKRWQAWRDGVEDYIYLHKLSEAIKIAKRQGADPKLITQAENALEKWPAAVLAGKQDLSLADIAKKDIIRNILLLRGH
ncbi:MAG: sugar-binding protein [Victivallales bacterium]